MPALTIPACGFCEGSEPDDDAGVQNAISEGGNLKGWSNYDNVKKAWVFVFDSVTPAERAVMRAEYYANRVTGGMTVTPLGEASALTMDYLGDNQGYKEKPLAGLFWQITLRMRER